MNIRVISIVTALTFTVSSLPLRADVNEEVSQELIAGEVTPAPMVNPPVADAVDSESVDQDYSEPKGTEVGKADESSQKAAKKRLWLNIGLAISAVVVAIVAMIVVSNNNGHHSD